MHATGNLSRWRGTSSTHSLLPARFARRRRGGFTLVEVLTATALTLILMSLLAGVFAQITDAVNSSRATIELNAQLTGVAYRLQKDLEGYTVRPDPNRRDFHDGYLTVMEGPLGTTFQPSPALLTSAGLPDTTLGDRDDILMLTTRSRHEPFVGRLGNDTFSSEVAEVAWFIRGTTLYRRVLLVGNPTINTGTAVAGTIAWWEGNSCYVRRNTGSPALPPQATPSLWNPANHAFYGYADLSVRQEGGGTDPDAANAGGLRLVPNTLGDLSIPRNRYCFRSSSMISDVRLWSPGMTPGAVFGLPVLGECSDPAFPFPTPGGLAGTVPTASGNFDQFLTSGGYRQYPLNGVDLTTGRMSAYEPAVGFTDPNNYRRFNEDVIMTNVIGFDIKVWDPGAPVYASNAGGTQIAVMPGDLTPVAYTSLIGGTPISYGAYVNLGYAPTLNQVTPQTHFNELGDSRSRLQAGVPSALAGGVTPNVAIYDTYTDQYDNDGLDQGGLAGADEGSNGFDDNGFGGIDDVTERELPPPYPFPLRGLQITLRVIEPDTQQVREIVVQQDFVLE